MSVVRPARSHILNYNSTTIVVWVTGQLTNTPTRGLPTRGLVSSQTGQLMDQSSRGLDNSSTGQLADDTTYC